MNESLFAASNMNPLTSMIYELITGMLIPMAIAGIIIIKRPESISKWLKVFSILFIIFYFPIFDMNCLWYFNLCWPEDFYPNVGGGYPLGMERPDFHVYFDYAYTFLNYVSHYLLWIMITLFIHSTSTTTIQYKPQWSRWKCWLPVINFIFIWDNASRILKGQIAKQIVLLVFMMFSFGWVYYRFYAPLMFGFFDIDAYTFVSNLLFGASEAFIYVPDIIALVIPFFLFLSGLSAIPVIYWVNKELKKDKKPKLSLQNNKTHELNSYF